MEYDFFNDPQSFQFDDNNDFYFEHDLFDDPFIINNEKDSQDSKKEMIDPNEKMDAIDAFYPLKNNSSSFLINPDKTNKNYIYENEKKKSDHSKFKIYTKRKLILSRHAQNFKNDYFLIFTNKKKFPKTIVNKIHKIIQGPLNLKTIPREIVRFNDKYFEEYIGDSSKIIQYLVTHKEEILALIPELSKY